MELPYFILAIAYGLGLVGCLGYFGMNYYHMHRFGLFDFSGKLVTFLTVSVVAIVLFFTALLVRNIIWTDTTVLFEFDSTIDFGV